MKPAQDMKEKALAGLRDNITKKIKQAASFGYTELIWYYEDNPSLPYEIRMELKENGYQLEAKSDHFLIVWG